MFDKYVIVLFLLDSHLSLWGHSHRSALGERSIGMHSNSNNEIEPSAIDARLGTISSLDAARSYKNLDETQPQPPLASGITLRRILLPPRLTLTSGMPERDT